MTKSNPFSIRRNSHICYIKIRGSKLPEPGSGITLSYNAESENEVNDVLNEVEKLGAIITKPAQKVFWGGYAGYFKDLDSHLIEVVYNLFWELDENDNLKLP